MAGETPYIAESVFLYGNFHWCVWCVCVGSHRQHALYIWDKATGSLVKMLTGHKGETLLDIVVSMYHATDA